MPITLNVSTFARSKAQSARLLDLSSQMDNFQRQVTTQKKYDTYTGFKADSYNLQNLKSKTIKIESYVVNIDKASTDMDQTINFLSTISEIADQVKSATLLRENDQNGIESLALFARTNLQLLQDILNEKGLDGNYLFSGTNLSSETYVDPDTLLSTTSSEITDWLNGTITTTQLETNMEALNSANLGFSSALDSAYVKKIQISDNLNTEYSINGNIQGVQDIVRALSLLANIEYPDAADVATESDLEEILTYTSKLLGTGVIAINDEVAELSSSFDFIKNIQESHSDDLALYENEVQDIENVDPSETLIKMQLLQTQLETAYQVTSIVAELSLVNFMR